MSAHSGLHRRLVRLNETALLIDAQLSHPGAIPRGYSAVGLHQRLFDSELAVTNIARFTEALAGASLCDEVTELIRHALASGIQH